MARHEKQVDPRAAELADFLQKHIVTTDPRDDASKVTLKDSLTIAERMALGRESKESIDGPIAAFPKITTRHGYITWRWLRRRDNESMEAYFIRNAEAMLNVEGTSTIEIYWCPKAPKGVSFDLIAKAA